MSVTYLFYMSEADAAECKQTFGSDYDMYVGYCSQFSNCCSPKGDVIEECRIVPVSLDVYRNL